LTYEIVRYVSRLMTLLSNVLSSNRSKELTINAHDVHVITSHIPAALMTLLKLTTVWTRCWQDTTGTTTTRLTPENDVICSFQPRSSGCTLQPQQQKEPAEPVTDHKWSLATELNDS